MRHSRRFGIVVTGAFFLALAAGGKANACSCARISRDAVIARLPVAFVGSVTSIRAGGPLGQVTTLRIVRPIKGVRRGAIVRVATRTSSAACGWDFRIWPRRLTVAGSKLRPGVLTTNSCTMRALGNLAPIR